MWLVVVYPCTAYLVLLVNRMNSNGVIKVSDFGLTEDIYTRNYFRQSKNGAKLPLKWMALESIKFGVFNEKSDVVSISVTNMQTVMAELSGSSWLYFHASHTVHVLILVLNISIYAVVLWRHLLGDIQWRCHPLHWTSPSGNPGLPGGRNTTQKTKECCL